MENFAFDKIEYVRPDIDKMEETCKEYTAKLRAAKSYEEVKQIILDYDKAGHRNHKKDDDHLNKHAMHLVRLLMTGIEILEKGEIFGGV